MMLHVKYYLILIAALSSVNITTKPSFLSQLHAACCCCYKKTQPELDERELTINTKDEELRPKVPTNSPEPSPSITQHQPRLTDQQRVASSEDFVTEDDYQTPYLHHSPQTKAWAGSFFYYLFNR